jgi:hypothetical protein
MNVTFHVITGAGIAHVAAIQIRNSRNGWFCRRDLTVAGMAIFLGVLSHGVLDGLKHGYPIRPAPDVLCAGLLALCWCLFARHRYRLLFASVILASLAPDIIDLGPKMLRSTLGIMTPMADLGHLFPWHWPDGSGSMYPAASHAPERTRILDTGQNEIISWTNHLIVIAFAASGILSNPWVFRFMPRRTGSYEGQEQSTLGSQ